jgi:magnesium-transporting ATPase (P-type)
VSSSGIEGVCYVETKNLDGETNLKAKKAPKEMSVFKTAEQFKDINTAVISCELPNKDIYKFDGKMLLPINVS